MITATGTAVGKYKAGGGEKEREPGLDPMSERPNGIWEKAQYKNREPEPEKARAVRNVELGLESPSTLLGENVQRPGPIELGVCELIAITAEATVAT